MSLLAASLPEDPIHINRHKSHTVTGTLSIAENRTVLYGTEKELRAQQAYSHHAWSPLVSRLVLAHINA